MKTANHIAISSGLLKMLREENTQEAISRVENIEELLNGIKEFTEKAIEKSEGDMSVRKTLDEYMEDVALLTDQDKETEDDFNKVTLMTVHAAKGLEFPYVFVVGLEENLFPSMMSGESQENLEEERRLFYVAMTRAKERLFLSFASTRFKWGQLTDCQPSRFISELDDKFLEKHEHTPKKKKEYNPYKIYAKTKYKKKEYSPPTKKFVSPKNLTNINRAKNISINESDLSKIQNGMRVKHSRFGEGKVLSISGEGSNRKATVFFNGVGQKDLLLKC